MNIQPFPGWRKDDPQKICCRGDRVLLLPGRAGHKIENKAVLGNNSICFGLLTNLAKLGPSG
jgi:hypothetical protein